MARPKAVSEASTFRISTTRPSATTAMRSQTERSSCNSEETITMVMPFSRFSLTRVSSTRLLAPISMPRVGSDTNRNLGFMASARATHTFCWLPPDSVPAVWAGDVQRMSNSRIISSA